MKKLIVVGATGLVGRNILQILEERDFPVSEIKLLASAKSAGKELEFKGEKVKVIELKSEEFDGYDIALFAAGGSVSAEYIPIAAEKGVRCVDNSSYFRMDPKVPLVVPELNPEAIDKDDYIIANPNCSTIQCMAPLYVLKKYGLKRVVFSSYQAVSGSGIGGLRDLDEGISEFYPYPIKNNVLPHIDDFLENGYTKEEMKMVNETKKILELPDLKVTATTVRVPVRFGHSVSINVELEKDFDLDEVKKSMDDASLGMKLVDDGPNLKYPMPIDAEGKDEILMGRIRRDESLENGLNLWSVADNTRKGAALNAIQIAEYLVKEDF